MLKAIIFENELGEWFIDWADPNQLEGPFQSLDEAIKKYLTVYPDLPKSYLAQPYSEQGEWT